MGIYATEQRDNKKIDVMSCYREECAGRKTASSPPFFQWECLAKLNTSRNNTAFTLIEILISIGIIAILLAISLPALSIARQRGRVAVCISNAQSINTAMAMYLMDNTDCLPWFYVHEILPNGQFRLYPGAEGFTTFSWGGMLPSVSHGQVDAQMTPVELRPFNRYLAPEARGVEIVRTYICPSDSSVSNPSFGYGGGDSNPIAGGANWQEFGTSYSINWHWLWAFKEPPLQQGELAHALMDYGPQLLKEYRGGPASRFIWNSENHFDQLVNTTTSSVQPEQPTGTQGGGWHGRFSTHTVMFLDGHAEHRYLDTRFSGGPDWTVIPKSHR